MNSPSIIFAAKRWAQISRFTGQLAVLAWLLGCSPAARLQEPKGRPDYCPASKSSARGASSVVSGVFIELLKSKTLLKASDLHGVEPESLLAEVIDFYRVRNYSDHEIAEIIKPLLAAVDSSTLPVLDEDSLIVYFDPTCSVCSDEIALITDTRERCNGLFPAVYLIPKAPSENAVAGSAVKLLKGVYTKYGQERYEQAVLETMAVLPSNLNALPLLAADQEIALDEIDAYQPALEDKSEYWQRGLLFTPESLPAIYLNGTAIRRFQSSSGYFNGLASQGHLMLVIRLFEAESKVRK